MNAFYESLRYLIIGTRFRRLSEAMLVDINEMYARYNTNFDAFWFPIFYILSRNEEVTNKFIADELMISQSAVSQLLSTIQANGYIKTVASAKDGRKKVVTFTPEGAKLQKRVEVIWDALQEAIESMMNEDKDSRNILKAISAIEKNFKKKPVGIRTTEILNRKKQNP